ncbi:MAG: hypothetical protein RSC68_08615 [Acinetobacter sp.]
MLIELPAVGMLHSENTYFDALFVSPAKYLPYSYTVQCVEKRPEISGEW